MKPDPAQRPGEAFNAVAEAYDAVRPGYPESLVDQACALGGLEEGSRVLEIGCGTGKLTEALVERRLRVDAVDPGPSMIELARTRTGHSDAVAFHVGRFEDVALPEGIFAAVFSATAFHWVDPSVSWAKAARALRPGGILALLMHIGYHEDATFAASEALREGAEAAPPGRRHLAAPPRPGDSPGGSRGTKRQRLGRVDVARASRT